MNDRKKETRCNTMVYIWHTALYCVVECYDGYWYRMEDNCEGVWEE